MYCNCKSVCLHNIPEEVKQFLFRSNTKTTTEISFSVGGAYYSKLFTGINIWTEAKMNIIYSRVFVVIPLWWLQSNYFNKNVMMLFKREKKYCIVAKGKRYTKVDYKIQSAKFWWN